MIRRQFSGEEKKEFPSANTEESRVEQLARENQILREQLQETRKKLNSLRRDETNQTMSSTKKSSVSKSFCGKKITFSRNSSKKKALQQSHQMLEPMDKKPAQFQSLYSSMKTLVPLNRRKPKE